MTTPTDSDFDKLSDTEKARVIAELNELDAKMACLNEPRAKQRAAAFMRDPGRLNVRVKAGQN